jgi:hypothetical protein
LVDGALVKLISPGIHLDAHVGRLPVDGPPHFYFGGVDSSITMVKAKQLAIGVADGY